MLMLSTGVAWINRDPRAAWVLQQGAAILD
jgi:hypothetical protein